MSEQESQIQQEARKILDKFAKALEKVEIKEKKLKRAVSGFREEKHGEDCDPEFRKKMFENAPHTKEDFLVAEKKTW
ncbi:MAG: hypothetical protein ABIH92_02905 [Nanoarchaeota archaeon]